MFDDENGFVVSAELIRVSTIVALGLSVGLVEVLQVSSELLEDLASVAGSMNQSYSYAGLMTKKACFSGSRFSDNKDFCGSDFDIVEIPVTLEDE